MTRWLLALSLVLGVALSGSLVAKGPTTKITLVNYSELSPSINITDDAVLRKFQVWAGPGVETRRGGATIEQTEGFIIDWSAGIITEHPPGLPHFNVIFYADSSGTPVYSVSYEPDFSTGWDTSTCRDRATKCIPATARQYCTDMVSRDTGFVRRASGRKRRPPSLRRPLAKTEGLWSGDACNLRMHGPAMHQSKPTMLRRRGGTLRVLPQC